MIEETLIVKIGNEVINVIIRIINLKQYLKDIGGIMLTELEPIC